MELSELRDKILNIFCIQSCEKLPSVLMKCVKENDTKTFDKFLKAIENNLDTDWLQMVYQYYNADRKEKKQDFTPRCVAEFLSKLIGESSETVDMCSGSGALTIQRWKEYPNTYFTLYEIDENVIPFLLFNLAVRNIAATVNQCDVLNMDMSNTWRIERGERFGHVVNIKPSL